MSDAQTFTVKIHFKNPGFLSENIFITGGEKPGFFISVYLYNNNKLSSALTKRPFGLANFSSPLISMLL
ncbi:Uncharacterized protein dnm_064080 [Desulfonema magnum]|uniref:Uncharacterized protein n=1 Tax=Desulfonema magnum TaxID=45655 RepID=A0A975BRZ7_9BACT|nr:Uncharacterized protein dnm_064080 [Desulfonema magnum]